MDIRDYKAMNDELKNESEVLKTWFPPIDGPLRRDPELHEKSKWRGKNGQLYVIIWAGPAWHYGKCTGLEYTILNVHTEEARTLTMAELQKLVANGTLTRITELKPL
jgi:hypothetical protein